MTTFYDKISLRNCAYNAQNIENIKIRKDTCSKIPLKVRVCYENENLLRICIKKLEGYQVLQRSLSQIVIYNLDNNKKIPRKHL